MQSKQSERLRTATVYQRVARAEEEEGEEEEEDEEEEPITFDIPYLSDQDILPGKYISCHFSKGKFLFYYDMLLFTLQ